MGFMRPVSGRCQVLGEDSHNLSCTTRARIGLLFEGHLAYEFMSIAQIEAFYAPFYPRWDRDLYYHLVDKLRLPHTHLIRNMSCGQRSQVVLGLIMAQQPELLLDDYSIGLDAGYRRLFLDDMREYLKKERRTVFLTSHVIQDMVDFVDEVIFLERGAVCCKPLLRISNGNSAVSGSLPRIPWPAHPPLTQGFLPARMTGNRSSKIWKSTMSSSICSLFTRRAGFFRFSTTAVSIPPASGKFP